MLGLKVVKWNKSVAKTYLLGNFMEKINDCKNMVVKCLFFNILLKYFLLRSYQSDNKTIMKVKNVKFKMIKILDEDSWNDNFYQNSILISLVSTIYLINFYFERQHHQQQNWELFLTPLLWFHFVIVIPLLVFSSYSQKMLSSRQSI